MIRQAVTRSLTETIANKAVHCWINKNTFELSVLFPAFSAQAKSDLFATAMDANLGTAFLFCA